MYMYIALIEIVHNCIVFVRKAVLFYVRNKYYIYTIYHASLLRYVLYDGIVLTVCTLPRGVCRISQGGGPNLKFLGFWIYMPRSGMSRAAKLRAFAMGVWGHAPPRKLKKWCNFVRFEGYFQPLSW